MEVTLLLGSILSPIASILGLIMNGIYAFFHLFGIQNIALTIVVFTFITKTLMIPLTIKQQKFTKLSSKMNPDLQKIQAKYKGKKDEASLRKQQAETQAVYQKYGVSPTSGCLPLLITLPILFALYQVINNIPDYVNLVRNEYETIASSINQNNNVLSFIVEQVKNNPKLTVESLVNNNGSIIDVLAKFNTTQWNSLLPKLSGAAVDSFHYIRNVNSFFGLNITNTPDWRSFAILIPILSTALNIIQSKQMTIKNKDANKDNPAANAMSSMNVVMPIMSGFFALILPIGVGLYWIANSLYTIIQQFFVNRYLDRVDVNELIAKSTAKNAKKFSKSSSNGTSLQELAMKQTKSIESTVSEKTTGSKKEESTESVEKDNSSNIKSDSYKPTSISEIANLLKNRNEKGDK